MKHHEEMVMSRQTPIRNQRSKGIKVKHVLQIFLLLAVCFWLIYQVKHSHDKKKEFGESDTKASISRGGSDTFLRLGRKDIRPQEEDIITKNEKHGEEAEEEEDVITKNEKHGEEAEEGEETTGIVDENKHEEDELEDKKVEDTENENMEGGDDEIEVHGLEKLDSEINREEFVDGEKGRDDDDEIESEEKESENGQMESESSSEIGDHDGDDTGTHEAREEHYKADDASSAVTHDTQEETTEPENQNDENVDGHPENILEETDMGRKKREELEEGGEMALDEKHSNVTIGEVKDNVTDGSENGSTLNTTVTEVSDDHLQTGNSSTEISTETNDQEILSEGTSLERSNLPSIGADQADNSTFVTDDNHTASNSTNPDPTKDAESNTLKSFEMSSNTDSTTETIDAIDAEKSYADDGASESLESENNENSEEVQQDSIDVSDFSHSLEGTHVRLDPDILPEIQTEGSNAEDTASE